MARDSWGWPLRHPEYHLPKAKLEAMRLEVDSLGDDCLMALLEAPGAESREFREVVMSFMDDMCEYSTLEKSNNEETFSRTSSSSSSSSMHRDVRVRMLAENVLRVPAWVDWAAIERGQAVFLRYAQSAAFGLLYFSLIGGFSAPKIVKVLDSTGYIRFGKKQSQYLSCRSLHKFKAPT